jgi:hypothetical protein
MATQSDQILDFILRFPGRDDDEIARLLKISRRQTVNIICRKLLEMGHVRRAKDPTGKIANYPVTISSRGTEATVAKVGGIEPDIEGQVALRPTRPPLTAEKLLRSGFKLSALWRLSSKNNLETDRQLPRDRGVYAFVKADTAVYVGVAAMGLSKRLYFYAKPGVTQRTNQRLNAILREEIRNGTSIAIYTVCPPDMDWNGLPVSSIAGLEIGLIEAFHLPWNIRGVR